MDSAPLQAFQRDMVTSDPRALQPLVGWQEWVQLPQLGLVAIKAKIDTGARTSALHADTINVVGGPGGDMVQFTVRPSRRRPEFVVTCVAPLVELRGVTSSNGTREDRPVIRTNIVLGDIVRSIDVTLTDRGRMTYRMLIGRQALTALGVVVDPRQTFQLPKLGYRLYPGWVRKKSVTKP